MASRWLAQDVAPRSQFLNDDFQRQLAQWNRERLAPAFPHDDWSRELSDEMAMRRLEGGFVEELRAAVTAQAAEAPDDADGFIAWFEALRRLAPASMIRCSTGWPRRPRSTICAGSWPGSRRRGRVRRSGRADPDQAARSRQDGTGAQLLGRDGPRQHQGHARPDARAPGRGARAGAADRDAPPGRAWRWPMR